MNREERLRNLILDRYASLRQFAQKADIPYSSLMILLSRGIGGASFDAVIHICRELELYLFNSNFRQIIFPQIEKYERIRIGAMGFPKKWKKLLEIN